MKKFFVGTLAVLLVFAFSGCGIAFTAERNIESSEIYAEKEISAAMNEVCKYFTKEFSGCRLLKLSYSDTSVPAAKEWAKNYEKEEAIVLFSDFYVFAEGDGSLQKGETYANWKWILVRNKGENWQLKTWGYG